MELLSGWEWSLKASQQEVKNVTTDILMQMVKDGLLMPATLFYIFILPLSRSYLEHGQNYQKNKPAWKKVMGGYNWFMAVLSFGMFLASASAMLQVPLYTEDCTRLWRQSAFKYTTKIFYFSKFIEYLDTFWLYAMNKSVSWLQWIHHLGAAALMWCAVHYANESTWIFVCMNSFIHTFMYSYYGLSLNRSDTTKKSWLDSVKPLVTSSQIVQFLSGFYFLYQYRKLTCYSTDAHVMIGVYYHTWLYVGSVLLLFINFYIRSYCKCGKKKSRSSKQDKGESNGTKAESNGNHTTTKDKSTQKKED